MRTPNPPHILLAGLDEEQTRKVVRLALKVVEAIAIGREWDAYSAYRLAELPVELHVAFWSLLDSRQRSTIESLAEAENIDL